MFDQSSGNNQNQSLLIPSSGGNEADIKYRHDINNLESNNNQNNTFMKMTNIDSNNLNDITNNIMNNNEPIIIENNNNVENICNIFKVDNVCNICILKNKKICYLDEYCKILIIRDCYNNCEIKIDGNSISKINYIMELNDGRILICYLDFLIKIIEIDYINKNYKFTNILKGHSNLISKVIELKNGYLCSCSFDGYIKLWKKNKDNSYEFEINLKLFEEGKFYSLLEVNEIIFSLLDFNNKNYLYIKNLNKREERIEYLQNINLKRENLVKLDDNNLLIGGNYVIYIYNINKNEEININCNYIICSLYVLKDNRILLGDNNGNLIILENILRLNFEIIKENNIKDEIDSLNEFEINDNICHIIFKNKKELKLVSINLN